MFCVSLSVQNLCHTRAISVCSSGELTWRNSEPDIDNYPIKKSQLAMIFIIIRVFNEYTTSSSLEEPLVKWRHLHRLAWKQPIGCFTEQSMCVLDHIMKREVVTLEFTYVMDTGGARGLEQELVAWKLLEYR
ncbi:hypothetical protein CBL_12861 [Carabus blaptoides fortunei]